MDIFSKEKRSEVMSKIRSKNTKLEKIVFRELRKRGVYFQKHYKRAPGNPDIALPSRKKAVFIDGDFWHGHDYENLEKKLSTEFWRDKIAGNMERDKRNTSVLEAEGWQVLRVWEHEIKQDTENAVSRIVDFLRS